MSRIAKTILKWEWLILLLLFVPLLFLGNGSGLLLFIIPLLWILRKIATGHFVPPTPYNISLLALLIAILLSLFAVFDAALSFPKIAGLILGVAGFFAAIYFVQQSNTNGKWYLFLFIVVSGSAMGLIGIMFSPAINIPSNAIIELLPQSLALSLNSVNVNEVAGVMGWVIPLLLAATFGYFRYFWRSGDHKKRMLLIFLLLMLLFNIFVLLASRSRGGILSLFIAIFFMVLIYFRRARFVIIASSIIIFISLIIGWRLHISGLLLDNLSIAGDIGLTARFEIWSRALYALADFPITGVSMNGFREIVFILYPIFSVAPSFDIAHAHNHLLQAGLDLGIPGLIAYLSIWLVSPLLIWQALKVQIDADFNINKVFLVGVAGSLIAGWSFGMLDAIALGARPGFLWWLLLALLIVVFEESFLEKQGQI